MAELTTIIAIIGGAVGIVVGGRGLFSVYQGWRQGRHEDKRATRDGFIAQIESAEARGDNHQANNLRLQHEAQEEAWRLAEFKPDDADSLKNRGIALEDAGHHAEAVRAFDQALYLRLGDPETLVWRGIALDNSLQHKEALKSFDEAVSIRPDHPDTLTNRGIAFLRLGRPQEALHDFDRTLTLRPDHPDALINRGIALRHLGRPQEALSAANEALAVCPDDLDAVISLGITLGQMDRHWEGLQAFDLALTLDAKSLEALKGRGTALVRLSRYEEALKTFDEVLTRPDHPGTLYNRALAYSLLKKPDEALDDLTQAIAIDHEIRAFARTEPDFDKIRSDPRFQALVAEPDPPDENADDDDSADESDPTPDS